MMLSLQIEKAERLLAHLKITLAKPGYSLTILVILNSKVCLGLAESLSKQKPSKT
jgi:hypothetical protein